MNKTLAALILGVGAISVCTPAISKDPEQKQEKNLLELKTENAISALPTCRGTSPAVAAADMNKDGLMDLVVATNVLNKGAVVYLLTNNGDGTYTEKEIAAAPCYLHTGPALEIADMNGDGELDIILSAQHTGGVFTYILHGQADGTYK